MVDLKHWPKKIHFRMYKAILCTRIPYFDKTLNGGFVEAKENTRNFPELENTTRSLDILIGWVYTGAIRLIIPDKYKNEKWNNLEFYVLLDKLCLFGVMDTAMDTHRKKHLQTRLVFSAKDVANVYRETSAGSTYRLYALYSLLYIFGYYPEPFEEEWMDDSIRDVSQTKSDLSNKIIEILRSQCGMRIKDPRFGNRYAYHCTSTIVIQQMKNVHRFWRFKVGSRVDI